MKAIILSIGNELTTGQTTDTNSAYLSQRLGEYGYEVIEHATFGDDVAHVAEGIQRASQKADLVIATGGLGPTPDDVTRDALAMAMGTTLHMDPDSLVNIEAYFSQIQRPMAEVNRVQAMVPQGAEAIQNTCGTAPGLAAKLNDAQVYITPGVPLEMRAMMEKSILPQLPKTEAVILHRTVRLFGLGESTLVEQAGDLFTRTGPVIVGTTVQAGMVSIRITSTANDDATAAEQTEQCVATICERLGEHVVSTDGEILIPHAVGELLSTAGQTLATAESCTGGMIGSQLTAVPGSSGWYLGGVVSYANEVKQNVLHVPESMLIEHGAVSRPVAAAMAEGVRDALGSDWAISTTGIAGPTGGTEDKPVGLVYTATASKCGTHVQEHFFPGNRQRVRLRATLTAMDTLRRLLRHQVS